MTDIAKQNDQPPDHRRTIVLVLSIVLLLAYLFGLTSAEDGNFKLISEMMGRVGLFLAALWLAWPSLQKPAQWVPPGVAMLCLIGLVILAAQPRLRVFVIPVIAAAIAFGVVVKAIRGSSK